MGSALKTLLVAIAFLAWLQVGDAALAAMSIDLGSEFIKLGLVKPGVPMEIVLNKESRRKTPNLLGIRNGERFFADAAAALSMKQPANVFPHLLSLLAREDGHPDVELYKKRFPFNSLSVDDRRQIEFSDGETKYNVETLLAMILWNAKVTTEAYAGQTVKDAVITIPAYYNQAERKAIARAAQIAGLNLLQLLSDGSAAALNYGVFRRKEINETRQTMLIFDVGATKTAATIVEYVVEQDKKTKEKAPVVRTLGVGFDRHLGGFDFTLRLRDHLVEAFRKHHKTKTDITTNGRSMAKLLKEAERVKQVLSANLDHYAQVESAHEDIDFRLKVTREEIEELCRDLFPRFETPFKNALAMAELSIDQIDQVVLMGAGTRMPRIQAELQRVIGSKEIGKFLNTDEAIALGAVYQAAHLSSSFKVLTFRVFEPVLYPIQSVTETGEKKQMQRTLFGYRSHYPTPNKIISFTSHKEDFDFQVNYGILSHLNDAQQREFGGLNLTDVKVEGVAEIIEKEVTSVEGSTFKGIKAHFAIDNSGIVRVASAEVIVEQAPKIEQEAEPEQPEPSTEAPKTDGAETGTTEGTAGEKQEEKLAAEGETTEKPNVDEEQKTEETKAEGKEEEKDGDKEEKTDRERKNDTKKAEETKKKEEPKPTTLKVPLKLTREHKNLPELSEESTDEARKRLSDFEAVEKAKTAREAALNALEALVYDLGMKIEEGEMLYEFTTEEERAEIKKEVDRLRLWLEDDVSFETTTEEFLNNTRILEATAKQANYRRTQSLDRPKLVSGLKDIFNHSKIFYNMTKNLTEGEDPVFTETELEVLSKLITETEEWWAEKEKELAEQPRNQDPIVTNFDISQKIRDLDREVKYLLNKLKSHVPKKKPIVGKNDTTTEEGEEFKVKEEGAEDEGESEEKGSTEEEEKTKEEEKKDDAHEAGEL